MYFSYNKADAKASGLFSDFTAPAAGGVWDASYNYNNPLTTGSSFYNCIFWGNYGIGSSQESTYQVGTSGFNSGNGFNPKVYNCYISATSSNQVTSGTNNIWNNADECYQFSGYKDAKDGTDFIMLVMKMLL